MITLYKVTVTNYEGHTDGITVVLDHKTGRTYASDPTYMEQIRKGELAKDDELKVIEVFTTYNKHLASTIIRDRWLERIPTMVGTYERVQRYGGPEEGGWYYYNSIDMGHKTYVGKMTCPEDEIDRYGEGYEYSFDVVPGQRENTRDEHYC